VRWEKGRWGDYLRLSPRCAREDLSPNVDRGRYQEKEVGFQQTTVNSYSFQVGVVGRNLEVTGEAEATTTSEIKLRYYDHAHIVVGVMSAKTGEVREVLVENLYDREIFYKNDDGDPFKKNDDGALFKKIRGAKRKLRPWWKSLFSLKSVQGFSLYRCYPENEYHERVEVDEMTRAVLSELWYEYNHQREDKGGRWLAWVQQHLNRGDILVRTADDEPGPADPGHPPPAEDERQMIPSPDARCLALQLVIKWSTGKIAVYGMTPILVSLAVGFWFQYSQEGDRIAVVQTAWTISSYIIGASGGECLGRLPFCCLG